MEPTDQELRQRAGRGDPSAFPMLVERHAPRLYQLAAVMLQDRHEAEDLVQETLLAAYQQLRRFEGRSAFRTWLIGILIRQAALARRRRRARPAIALHEASEPGGTADPTARSDARLDLMDLMARLSEEHRQVLLLREIEGLSYEEMAALLELPRGTVESRLFRARQALRDLIGSDGTRNLPTQDEP